MTIARRCRGLIRVGLLLIVCGASVLTRAKPIGAESPSAEAAEREQFFATQVRPLLAGHCQECHGAKKQESGLRLDSRQAVIDVGDSGEQAAVAGEPERSLLVKAINHVGDYRMPP